MIPLGNLGCYPKIVPVNRPSVITIQSMTGDRPFSVDRSYYIAVYPLEESGSHVNDSRIKVAPTDGMLRMPFLSTNEQEYSLIVFQESGSESEKMGEYHVYAVQDDLLNRFPYKGDLHIHSNRSDGQEPPAYVAGACRRIGLDFMAVTDHRQYAPSLEAIDAFSGLPIDLGIFPGEEIHPPENLVHMINFGGKASINDLFSKKSVYFSEVKALEKSITTLPAGWLRHQYASCLWCYQKIRAFGGLAIFCHPYWLHNHSYNVPELLIAEHFANLPFDAFELIGGYHPHEIVSNRLQVARYHEERAEGKKIPIIGVSDAHGCENGKLFGWYYTIVFSPSPNLPDLIQSIKDLFSVAVEGLPGEKPYTHGPFRLAKYSQFLLREVLPLHDNLCAEEGRAMLAHLSGSPQAEYDLAQQQGSVAALYDRLWGSN